MCRHNRRKNVTLPVMYLAVHGAARRPRGATRDHKTPAVGLPGEKSDRERANLRWPTDIAGRADQHTVTADAYIAQKACRLDGPSRRDVDQGGI